MAEKELSKRYNDLLRQIGQHESAIEVLRREMIAVDEKLTKLKLNAKDGKLDFE